MIKAFLDWLQWRPKHYPPHKWQDRGQNRWGKITYKVCTRCGEAVKLVSKPFQEDIFEKCERIKELDDQFDENNNYIYEADRRKTSGTP